MKARLVKPVEYDLSSRSSVFTPVSPISKTEISGKYPVKFYRILPDSGILPNTGIRIRYILTNQGATRTEMAEHRLRRVLVHSSYVWHTTLSFPFNKLKRKARRVAVLITYSEWSAHALPFTFDLFPQSRSESEELVRFCTWTALEIENKEINIY